MEKYTQNYAFILFKVLVFILEGFLMFLSVLLAYRIGNTWMGSFPDDYLSLGLICALGWTGFSSMTGSYDNEVIFERRLVLSKLGNAFIFQALLLFFIFNVFSTFNSNPATLFTGFTFGVISVFIARVMISVAYKYRRLLFKDYKVVIIGSGTTANALYNFFTGKMTKVYRLWENTDPSQFQEDNENEEIIKQVNKVKDFCKRNDVREIYCTLPITSKSIIEDISEFADNNYIQFRLANDFNLLSQKDIQVYFYDQTPIITMRKDPLSSLTNRTVKRAFDLIFSSLVLLLIFPPMLLVIGTFIKLSSPGPIFYMQTRSGRKNRSFKCFKFRTMVANADKLSEKYVQATKGDPRITKIGAFLRKTSLDEFPQFINVFLGHMSVVGPRPHPLKLNDIYAKKIQNYFFRYYITPGITGFAQINGYRGETMSDPGLMKKRVELDSWYIQNWSLLLDIKIIIKTFTSVFTGDENAY